MGGWMRAVRDTYENTRRGIFMVRNGPTFAKRHFSSGADGRGQGRRRREGSGGEEKLEDILEKSNWPTEERGRRGGPHFYPNMSSSDDNFRRSNLNSAPPPPRIEIARSTFLSFVSPRLSRVWLQL